MKNIISIFASLALAFTALAADPPQGVSLRSTNGVAFQRLLVQSHIHQTNSAATNQFTGKFQQGPGSLATATGTATFGIGSRSSGAASFTTGSGNVNVGLAASVSGQTNVIGSGSPDSLVGGLRNSAQGPVDFVFGTDNFGDGTNIFVVGAGINMDNGGDNIFAAGRNLSVPSGVSNTFVWNSDPITEFSVPVGTSNSFIINAPGGIQLNGPISGVASNIAGATLTNFVLLSSHGNDATAAFNDASKPSATITNALRLLAANALANGLIFIPPGENITVPNADGTLTVSQSVTVIAFGATITNSGQQALFRQDTRGTKLHIIGGKWNSAGSSSGGCAFKIGGSVEGSVLMVEHVSPSISGHDWILRNGGLTEAATIYVNDVDVTILPGADFVHLPTSGTGTNSTFVVRNSAIHNYATDFACIRGQAGNKWTLENCFFESYTNESSVGGAGLVTAGGVGCVMNIANCAALNRNGATNYFLYASVSGVVNMQSPFATDAQIFNDGTATVTNSWGFMARDTVTGNGGGLTNLSAANIAAGSTASSFNGGAITNVNATPAIGTIFTASTFSSLAGFTNNNTTVSAGSGKLNFSGGAGTFTQSLDYEYPHTLDKWTIKATIVVGTINGTSFGLGLGVRSRNFNQDLPLVGRINLSTAGTQGQIIINSTAGAQVAASATGLTVTAGDVIILTVTRNQDTVTVSANNLTTQGATLSVSYQFPTVAGTTSYLPNTGDFAIFNFGGSQSVSTLTISSDEIKNADIAFVGDSKVVGYSASSLAASFPILVQSSYKSTTFAGGSDTTSNVLQALPSIIASHPKTVVLEIGSNDPRYGVSSAVYLANYSNIVYQLQAAGIAVYHLLPLYETVLDQSSLSNYVAVNYSGATIDSGGYNYAANSSLILAADGVHPNDFYNQLIAAAVVKFYGNLNVSKVVLPYNSPWSVFTNQFYNSNAATATWAWWTTNNNIFLGTNNTAGTANRTNIAINGNLGTVTISNQAGIVAVGSGIVTATTSGDGLNSLVANNTSASGQSGVSLLNSAGAIGTVFKLGGSYAGYKTLTASAMGVFNNSASGDMVFLNDNSSGKITMAAGGASSPHVTIGTAGAVTLSSYIGPTNGILFQSGAQITNIYTATATLDFANLAAIGCEDLTITVTGAAVGDVVDLGVPNASVVANSSYSAWVSAADTVSVRFCTLISGDPASGLFRAEVHKWK